MVGLALILSSSSSLTPLQGDDENHAIDLRSDEGELITMDPPTRTGKAVRRSMNDWWQAKTGGVKRNKSREREKVNHTTGSTKAWDTPKTPTRWEKSKRDAAAARSLSRDKRPQHNTHLHIEAQSEQREHAKMNGISIMLHNKKDSGRKSQVSAATTSKQIFRLLEDENENEDEDEEEDELLRDVLEISRKEVEIEKVTWGGEARNHSIKEGETNEAKAEGRTQRDSEEESNDDMRGVPDKDKISEEEDDDEDTERDEDLIQGVFKRRNGSFVVERPTHAFREEVEEEGRQVVEVEWQSDPSDKKDAGEQEKGEGDENEGREMSDLPEKREEGEQERSEVAENEGIEQTDPPEKKEEGEQEEGEEEEEDGGSDQSDEKEDEFKSKLAQMTPQQRRSMAAQLGVPMTRNPVLLSDRMWVAYNTLKRDIASEAQEEGTKENEDENEEKEAEGEENEEEDEDNHLQEDDEGIEGGGEISHQLAETGEEEDWVVHEVPSSGALCTEMPSHAREYAVAGEAEGALLIKCEGRQQDMWVKWGECMGRSLRDLVPSVCSHFGVPDEFLVFKSQKGFVYQFSVPIFALSDDRLLIARP